MYIYQVENIGLVGLFLFDDQLKTEIYNHPNMLRTDLRPSLVKIEDGQIRIIRELKQKEYKGEFQNKETGRKYMTLNVGGVQATVYFDTFYSFPYEEILRLYSEGKSVSEDLLLSAFLKQTDKVAAIVPLHKRDTLICGFASTCSEECINVLCIPEEDRFKKDSWHYKMTFAPAQEQQRLFAASMTTYTSDIHSLINEGVIKLVNKTEYIEKIDTAMQEIVENLKKKSLFKKKVKNCKTVSLPCVSFGGVSGCQAIQATVLDEQIACILTEKFVSVA